jgi:hypothetical protein
MKQNVPKVRGFVLVIILTCTLYFQPSYGQSLIFGNSNVEAGLHIGPSNFLGDVGGNQGVGTTFLKDINLPFTKLMVGGYVTVYPAQWFGVRLAANYGHVEGHDSIINDKGGPEHDRKVRNLGFRSVISEAYVAAEIYPTVFFERYDGYARKLRPYGLIGVGIYHFNPRAKHGNEWVDLKPLRLEGQGMAEYPDRKEYKLTQINIPMGLGFKYYVNEKSFVGMEVLHRKTFTDYIDNVSTTYIDPNLFYNYMPAAQAQIAQNMMYRERNISRPFINQQRGNPKDNDSYLSMCLKFGVRLNTREERNIYNQRRCPARW